MKSNNLLDFNLAPVVQGIASPSYPFQSPNVNLRSVIDVIQQRC